MSARSIMRASLLITVVAGCGRLGFEPVGTVGNVAIDSTGAGVITATGVSSIDLSTLDVGTMADECLVAGLALTNQASANVTLKWNGVDLTQITQQTTNGSDGMVVIARLIAPDRGIHTLTATWTGTSDAILGALSFSGADQVECARSATAASGTSGMPSVTIASAPGHMTVDMAVTTSSFATATQTAQWIATAGRQPVLVQQTTHTTLAVTSDACTLAAPPAPGNLLLFVGSNVAGSLQTVTGGGVTWQFATSATVHSNVEIWYGEPSTGSGQVVTYTATTPSSMMCWVGEVSGLITSGSLDIATESSGLVGPVLASPLTTTAVNDLVLFGASTHATATWGVPTQGPWTALSTIDNTDYSQVEFFKTVAAPATWDPSIATTNTAETTWDAVTAAFKSNLVHIGGALSTAHGASSNTHAWSTDAPGFWASVGADIFPQSSE